MSELESSGNLGLIYVLGLGHQARNTRGEWIPESPLYDAVFGSAGLGISAPNTPARTFKWIEDSRFNCLQRDWTELGGSQLITSTYPLNFLQPLEYFFASSMCLHELVTRLESLQLPT